MTRKCINQRDLYTINDIFEYAYWYYKIIKHSSDHVITTKYSNMHSGVETTVFEYTLRHVTAKFAHMNGHWKAYN